MILIEKSKRRLSLIRDSETRFCCPISLGVCPEGHKQREGDGRTPEGTYRLCSVNYNSKYHLSLGVSYPSRREALRARREGRLGIKDCLLIVAADLMRLRPKWTSPLGGYIMIHGESPEGKKGDWTQGCIALCNRDIETLASLCKRGERIEIKP